MVVSLLFIGWFGLAWFGTLAWSLLAGHILQEHLRTEGMSSRIVPFEQMEDSTDTQRAYSTQMSGASTATAGTSTEFSDPSFATENDLNFADQIPLQQT